MNKHYLDIVFLVILLCITFFAFFGQYLLNERIVTDNAYLGQAYFIREKELIDACGLDYNEYLTEQRQRFIDKMQTFYENDIYNIRWYGGSFDVVFNKDINQVEMINR